MYDDQMTPPCVESLSFLLLLAPLIYGTFVAPAVLMYLFFGLVKESGVESFARIDGNLSLAFPDR